MDTNTSLAIRELQANLTFYNVKITKLEAEKKSLETDLEICETRIEELEKENKKLQEENRKNVEQVAKNTVESDDERVKAAYKDGYGAAITKISECLQEMKFDAVDIKQDSSALQKAFLEDYGRYYFKVFGHATTKIGQIL